MKTLSFKSLPRVTSLPAPSGVLEGVMVELTTDKKPYYCDGVAWVDLSSAGGGGGTPTVSFVNGELTTLTVGTPIYISGAGEGKRAIANASPSCKVLGLVQELECLPGGSLHVQGSGSLSATPSQWDTITGGTGGLVAGSTYYLSSTIAGGLTLVAPETGFVCEVGVALSHSILAISIKSSVKL